MNECLERSSLGSSGRRRRRARKRATSPPRKLSTERHRVFLASYFCPSSGEHYGTLRDSLPAMSLSTEVCMRALTAPPGFSAQRQRAASPTAAAAPGPRPTLPPTSQQLQLARPQGSKRGGGSLASGSDRLSRAVGGTAAPAASPPRREPHDGRVDIAITALSTP